MSVKREPILSFNRGDWGWVRQIFYRCLYRIFFHGKKYLILPQFSLSTAAANFLNHFLLQLKKIIDNHNHYRQNRK